MQFWLKPGETAVTLGPGEERREERIPDAVAEVFVKLSDDVGCRPEKNNS